MSLRIHLHYIFFFFNDTATTEIYTLSLHDALPISGSDRGRGETGGCTDRISSRRFPAPSPAAADRYRLPGGGSEEHTSELQSLAYFVCRLLLEKKKKLHY